MKAISPLPSRLATCLLALLPFATAPADGQAQEDGLVDRVVAIVGDSVVLLSEIIQQENQMQTGGATLPPENTPRRDSIRQRIVGELIDIQLILQAAARDTLLRVDEERVEAALQQEMDQVEGRFPSRDEFGRALAEQGLSLQTFREMRREQLTQLQLRNLYLQRYIGVGAVEVTEDEMRAVFEAGRAGLQQRPATFGFKHIMMAAGPSDSAEAAARARIEELLERVRGGEDFAELATLHSQDPGSAAAGGDLGWFRRGDMAEDFENTAFGLFEGGISDVVETEYGFHIIQVERVRSQERAARHILIRPEVGLADIARSRQLAEDIATRARSEDFQALIDEHHDGPLPDSALLPLREVAEYFPAAYIGALSQHQAGEIAGPIQFTFAAAEHFAVLKILEVREAGEYIYEDLEESIRASLIEQKRVAALTEALRAKTYVEIKGY
jgi:peptidyl-prolyl cis-trans isomerase SurA